MKRSHPQLSPTRFGFSPWARLKARIADAVEAVGPTDPVSVLAAAGLDPAEVDPRGALWELICDGDIVLGRDRLVYRGVPG